MELHPGRDLTDEDEPITLTDLAGVILGNVSARRSGPADLAAWHERLPALLLSEMGVEWQDDPEATDSNPLGLPRMAVRLPRMYVHLRRPTDGILEYAPRPGEEPVLRRLLPKVDAGDRCAARRPA